MRWLRKRPLMNTCGNVAAATALSAAAARRASSDRMLGSSRSAAPPLLAGGGGRVGIEGEAEVEHHGGDAGGDQCREHGAPRRAHGGVDLAALRGAEEHMREKRGIEQHAEHAEV